MHIIILFSSLSSSLLSSSELSSSELSSKLDLDSLDDELNSIHGSKRLQKLKF